MNVKNRTIFENDNLFVLRGLDTESIDLIYLDPPFNSNRNYAAPIGSKAAGAAFKDTWSLSDTDNAWHGELADREPSLYQAIHASEFTHGKGMKSYLIMLGVRLLEMKRVLKNTGSIYLHCDPTASHYLKMLMDSVFGKDYFQNEIIWYYKNASRGKNRFAKSHDIILWYSISQTFTFNREEILVPYESSMTEWRYKKQGKEPPKGKTPEDVITIPSLNTMAKERTGYPTQKPLALLDRIIKASSNEGDIVLDPFCGCATTCVAAERLGREWIGIDLSSKAVELVRLRLEKEMGMFYDITHHTDIPKRSEKLPNYKTHKHVLFGEQEGLCKGCKTYFPFKNFTIDHIVAKSKGGTDHKENLQLLCNYCNSLKGNGTQAELLARLKNQKVL